MTTQEKFNIYIALAQRQPSGVDLKKFGPVENRQQFMVDDLKAEILAIHGKDGRRHCVCLNKNLEVVDIKTFNTLTVSVKIYGNTDCFINC